jgi:hypothetical protein
VERRVRLGGVVAIGAESDIELAGATMHSTEFHDPGAPTRVGSRLVAATPGLFAAVRASILDGRTFDTGHVDRRDEVAVVGRRAAERLGVGRVVDRPAVFVGDRAYTVVGIASFTARERELDDAVIIPYTAGPPAMSVPAPTKVLIETAIGAAGVVAAEAPLALAPNDPGALTVSAPADAEMTRRHVQSDVNSLFLLLGVITLLVGAIGIANVTLVTVMERTGEIGLRRALGASRTHVALQFLAESSMLGLLGGVLGASAAVLVVVGVAASREWTPVLAPWVPLLAPALGATVGLVAGLYPSWRAASLEPLDALRAGV